MNIVEEYLMYLESDKKWIQKAIKPSDKGKLHKALKVPQGKKIPKDKLKVKSTDSPRIKKMKILAATLAKLRKKKK